MGLKRFFRKYGKQIGAVASFVQPYVGAAISAASAMKGAKRSNEFNTAQSSQEYERQKEFAQMGIRWKVEDAKAAGLHPLFALGAQTASYSPVSVQDSVGPAMAQAGQEYGRAVAATATFQERELARLALRQAQNSVTQGDLTNEQLRLQNRQLENDLLLAPVTMPQFEAPQIDFGGGEVDAAKRQTATQYQTVPGDTSLALGATPMWREFSIGNGRSMVLPGGMSGDAAEVLESLGESPSIMLATLEENRRRFGPEFADWMYDRYFKTPLRRQVEKIGGIPTEIARQAKMRAYSRNVQYLKRRPDSGKRWKQVR